MDKLELRCKECTAFLRIKPQSTFISEVICANSKCKFVNQIKVVNNQSSIEDIKYKFEELTT